LKENFPAASEPILPKISMIFFFVFMKLKILSARSGED
jgi:hypothetical protein